MNSIINRKKNRISGLLFYGLTLIVILQAAVFLGSSAKDERHPARKVLFIGDSMTGWLSERLNAYGEVNGFDVSTVVWDGSTISRWANSPRLAEIIKEQDPDAIFISLGLNELFEPNPGVKLREPVEKIITAVGDRPMLWVGPPSWPGHQEGGKMNDWLEKELGDSRFFKSFGMTLQRQGKKNPHPTKAGIVEWMDSVVRWMPGNSEITLPGIRKPEGGKMSRGETFIYKRMKENL